MLAYEVPGQMVATVQFIGFVSGHPVPALASLYIFLRGADRFVITSIFRW